MNNKKGFKNLVIMTLVLWGGVILIKKMFYPQFISLDGLISAIRDRNIIVVLYLFGMLFYVLLSYISFFYGLIIIYEATIGNIIRALKTRSSLYEFRQGYSYDREYYGTKDVILIFTYTIVALPLMLYFMLPALIAVLILVFIYCCILIIGNYDRN